MINGIPEWEDIPQCPQCGAYGGTPGQPPEVCVLCGIISDAIAHEREACAKHLESRAGLEGTMAARLCFKLAEEIRARGAK